jgi:hypothetical protein
MAIYRTRWFDRWARKEGLTVSSLCAAVREMMAGLYDADLGSGLFKKRVARPGQGKSRGYRTLVATNKGDRWFFVYGFPKSKMSNIDNNEEESLKKLAAYLLSVTDNNIEKAICDGELVEVDCDDKEQV